MCDPPKIQVHAKQSFHQLENAYNLILCCSHFVAFIVSQNCCWYNQGRPRWLLFDSMVEWWVFVWPSLPTLPTIIIIVLLSFGNNEWSYPLNEASNRRIDRFFYISVFSTKLESRGSWKDAERCKTILNPHVNCSEIIIFCTNILLISQWNGESGGMWTI